MRALQYSIYILLIYLLYSCSSLTRTEEEILTITKIDTNTIFQLQNIPGNRDNGIIFPSSRTITKERTIVQRDSIIRRYYPDFIRAGFFESIGTIGGNSINGIGTGLFGVMPDLSNLSKAYRGGKNKLFTGGIYRFGIMEWKLNIFEESPNWSYGINTLEIIVPDARAEKALYGLSAFYLRKRFFLRNDIPYLAITPSIGFSVFPSIYTNLSASLDLGSIGGFNIRTYAGIALGYNPPYSPQIKENDFTKEGQSVVHPYFGIGASYLDFLNRDEEMEIEWKDYKHSSWDIGLLQFGFYSSNSDKPIFDVSNNDLAILKGLQLKLANANVALPILNYRVYAGSSLLSIIAVGMNEYAISILPIRLGYNHNLIPRELSLEPFIELGYFPMYSANIGAKLALRISEIFNISINTGLITASKELNLGKDIEDNLGKSFDITKFYLGVSFNIYDRIFDKGELRYFK